MAMRARSMIEFIRRTVIAVVSLAFSYDISLAAAPLPDSAFPGTVVAHGFANSNIYLGTPSIVILDDGTYLVSHDTFGPGSSQDTVEVYKSADRGKSWSRLVLLKGQYYSSLFTNHGWLYIIGLSSYEGVPVIRRSIDGGRTWSTPTGPGDGVLATDGKYFSAGVPVIIANGKLWRTIEKIEKNGVWIGMMSADVDSDLLNASNWTFSTRIGPDASWLNRKFNGWLEGNAVLGKSGDVVDLLRIYYNDEPEKAAIATVENDGRKMNFDPDTGFVDMPGGGKKFTVRFDPVSGCYWSLTNAVYDGSYHGTNYERARNTLALISSADLRNWKICRTVLHSDDAAKHGFQYVDWVFDGTDIVSAVRTAYDDNEGGAHSQHDSNFITFVRVPEFRSANCE